MFSTLMFADQTRLRTLERVTGAPVRWSGWVGRWAALQASGDDPRHAGLIWLETDGFGFASLRYDPADIRHHALSDEDVAAIGLAALGLVTYSGPRRHRKLIRARRIPAALVQRHAATLS